MVGSIWEQCIASLINVFSAVGGWFTQLFNSVPGALAFIVAMFIAFLSLRAFIRPLIGSTPSAFHEVRYPHFGRPSSSSSSSDTSPAQGSLEWYARTGGKR